MVGTTDIPEWCYVEAYGSEGRNSYTEATSAEDLSLFHSKSPISHISKVCIVWASFTLLSWLGTFNFYYNNIKIEKSRERLKPNRVNITVVPLLCVYNWLTACTFTFWETAKIFEKRVIWYSCHSLMQAVYYHCMMWSKSRKNINWNK